MRISLTLDDITHYIFNALIVNELASLDIARCYHLLPNVFHLDGHILGTKIYTLLLSEAPLLIILVA